MARYVLLAFEDNGDAEALVAAIQNRGAKGIYLAVPHPSLEGQYSVHSPYGGNVDVRAMFMKPTQFCECTNPGDKSAKGKKWGLWIHSVCGKPKKSHWQHPRNLLEPEKLDPRERSCYLGVVEGGKPYEIPEHLRPKGRSDD